MAETYGIIDIRGLPASKLAALVLGLRDNSRVKMIISGVKCDMQTVLLASIVDRLSLLVWLNSKDGYEGRNRPKSVLNTILGNNEESAGEYKTFSSVDDFEKYRRSIIERMQNDGNRTC